MNIRNIFRCKIHGASYANYCPACSKQNYIRVNSINITKISENMRTNMEDIENNFNIKIIIDDRVRLSRWEP